MNAEPVKVLLIEDDEDDYIITRDLLYDIPHVEFSIRWETTYEDGLDALQLGAYDVCLMDYHLGRRDGMSILRALNVDALGTPIIFLTGQDSRDLDLKAMQAGASDYLVKGSVDAPLLERSIRYAIQRQRMLTEMHRRSLIDELTGLLNRRGFEEQATRQLQLAGRRKQAMALLYLDVDGLKAINDHWGHNEGDRALAEVGELIRSSFRRSDILARVGGDEFVMIPVDAVPPRQTTPEARLLRAFEHRNETTDRPYTLSASIGTSLFDPTHPAELWDLVEEADAAMYEQKSSGR